MPGELYRSILDPYRDSGAVIERTDLDDTILRPGWFTRDDNRLPEMIRAWTKKNP